jgi:hypothetical protein
MIAKFTALPVGLGDAFLWQPDEGTSVLVDGGLNKKRAVAELLCRSVTHLRVVVCTHADADHVDGLVAVLQEPRIRVDEVWVPARWGEGLAELASDPFKILEQLCQECRASTAHKLEDVPAGEVRATETGSGADHDDAVDDIEEAVATGPDLEAVLSGHAGWVLWSVFLGPRCVYGTLLLEAVQVAGSIWKVVRAALHTGAVLRWFEYGAAPGPGGTPWLYPVNAAQTLHVRRTRSVLHWLRLTLKNEEALVFLGEKNGAPPVLFASDSDFKFSLARVPKTEMLITAPHHGAAANGHVYGTIVAHAPAEHLWVRSDTAHKHRPCPEYQRFPRERRACTGCAQCPRTREPVTANLKGGRWILSSDSCPK